MDQENRRLTVVAAYFIILVIALVILRPMSTAAGTREDALAAEKRDDYTASAALWQQLAEKGDAEAQYKIGMQYWTGRGIKDDREEAERWLMKSADQNYAPAEEHFGRNLPYTIYRHQLKQLSGIDLRRESEKWFLRAVEHGGAEEQLSLALFYLDYGSPSIQKKGYEWAFKAAESGNLNAKCYLVMRCTPADPMTPELIDKKEDWSAEQKTLAKKYLGIRNKCQKTECIIEPRMFQ